MDYEAILARLTAIEQRLAVLEMKGAAFGPLDNIGPFGRGCRVCGIGANGEALGYVCPRTDCPSRFTC